MAEFKLRAKNEREIKDKPRVYFTCHHDDFERYSERVMSDLFRTQDCAVFYTEDMTEPLTDENLSLDLERMNLVVVPVTLKLLTLENRAMSVDIPYAMKAGVPVLPLMMEEGIVEIYSRPDRFGERQFISPDSREASEISYDKKLSDFLESVLTSGELAKKVRAAFDAYIFLSYRKKDRVFANELMRLVHENPKYRDIAIWYDEFLSPGESFRDNITRALSDSRLFALLVTPNLLEVPNFVMDEEYPAARKSGKPILPVEMADTDRAELSQRYEKIPAPVNAAESATLYERLDEMLVEVASSENDNDPEHNYLIGLAYLGGIDVEVNRQRGMELIIAAAEAEHLDALEKLLEIYEQSGDYREALKWSRRLYEYYLKTRGEEDEQTINLLMHITNALHYLDDYEAALECCEKVYKIAERVYPETSDIRLTASNDLAVIYLNLGRAEEARVILENVFNVRKRLYGETHPETIIALTNLASAYFELNDERAVAIMERAHELNVKVYGAEHPSTAHSLHNLAEFYSAFGNEELSFEYHLRAYEMSQRVCGDNHLDTLTSLLELALTYSERGESEQAIRLLLKGRETALLLLGEEHKTTIRILGYLADEYKTVSDGINAVRYYREAYEICLRVLGESDEETREAKYRLNMAEILFKLI